MASHPGCMPGGLLPAGEICQFKRSGYAPVTVSCVQQPLPEAGDAFSTNPLKLVAQQCSGLAVPNAAVVLASTGYPVKVLCNAGYTCSSPSCQVTCLDARDGVGSLWSTPPHCVGMQTALHREQGWYLALNVPARLAIAPPLRTAPVLCAVRQLQTPWGGVLHHSGGLRYESL